MDLVKRLDAHVGASAGKFYKTTLFRSGALLLGVNCLEPGQAQKPHAHADQDKFYYVVAGNGRFQLADQQITAGVGAVIWAPAGIMHGVENEGNEQLILLVGIAPAP